MSIFVVDWKDASYLSWKGVHTQVQAVAAIAISIHEVKWPVVVKKDFSKLSVSLFT